jgi:hypothetical protein
VRPRVCATRRSQTHTQIGKHGGVEAELSALISALVRPSRVTIVAAKRRILRVLADGGRQQTAELLRVVAEAEGADPFVELSQLKVYLPSRDAIAEVVTADHPAIASLRADVIGHEALAELAAEGWIVAAGTPTPAPDSSPRFGYSVPGLGDSVVVSAPRPAPPSDVVWLPHRLRAPDVWNLEPDVFVADLEPLRLDARTERCLREALASYRRGVFLAAASLLGAATEGAWYAAGQVLRSHADALKKVADTERTAQVQSAVAHVLREAIPKSRRWEADELAQHAALMRRIRNYGVHPREDSDEGLEVYFEEDRCGLLFLEAHRHLTRLGEIVRAVAPESEK